MLLHADDEGDLEVSTRFQGDDGFNHFELTHSTDGRCDELLRRDSSVDSTAKSDCVVIHDDATVESRRGQLANTAF